MTERDDENNELGPKDNTDDSTLSDAGLTGTPAGTSTPIGQGDEPGTGADDEGDRTEAND